MNRVAALAAALALLPLGLNARAAPLLLAPVCGKDGAVRMIPLPGQDKEQGRPDCAKACHFGTSRKRSGSQFEREQ